MISATDLETLRALETSLWHAETRFDLALMKQTFAPEFTEIGGSGRVWSREECLALETQEIACRLPLPNFAARLLSADIAQVTYISVVTSDGIEAFAQRSSIWRRDGAGWRLVFHQGTPTSGIG